MNDGNENMVSNGLENNFGGGNLSGNFGDITLNPLTPNFGDLSGGKSESSEASNEPEYTGLTETVEETIEYSMDERKDNAMSLAKMVADLETLKQEYENLVIENNNAIRAKLAEISELEKEISDVKAGVVNGSVIKEVTYDIYDTLDKKIYVPINKEPIEANFSKIINKTTAEIEQYKLTHNIKINEPDVTVQPVVDNKETM